MDLVLYSSPGEGLPQDLILLVDEMQEDPRCHMVALGIDHDGAVLVSLWDGEVAAEVADGLGQMGGEGAVRRLEMPTGLGAWD